jgi:galactokinase
LSLDYRSLEWRALPLPKDVTVVIADTTKRRTLTSGEYNSRRADCEESVRLLENGDTLQFCNLLNECHISLRDLYEVSIPELDLMVRVAQSLPGCCGARLTGAGFGGCTVNIVSVEKAGEFAKQLAAGYVGLSFINQKIVAFASDFWPPMCLFLRLSGG